jgi:hypothetical protein
MTCPMMGNKNCTVGGQTGKACDPTIYPQCKSCP